MMNHKVSSIPSSKLIEFKVTNTTTFVIICNVYQNIVNLLYKKVSSKTMAKCTKITANKKDHETSQNE